MMDSTHLLLDSADRIFSDLCDKTLLDAAEQGEFPEVLWRTLVENGFHQLATAGSGIALKDVFAVIGLAGRHALPVPLAETLLANRWLADPEQAATIGTVSASRVVDVPWGRRADVVLGLDAERDAYVVLTPGAEGVLSLGSNAAGEPRDEFAIPADADWIQLTEHAPAYLALARAVAMAGCLERVLEMSLQYAGEREQFGRAIARFQAVQHNLAIMAGETAAARRAADAAMDALGGDRIELEVAVAKSRVGEAAGVVAEIAHQVHGAMGFTHEHSLHHFTRRAWAWRDEHGNEAFWQQRLGRHLAMLGADSLWDFLATRG